MTVEFDPHPGKFATLQEACTYAYIQVVKQGRASVAQLLPGSGQSGCAYRGHKGLKCFVGHIIPDEHYSDALENLTVTREAVSGVLGLSIAERLELWDVEILKQLQRAHDDISSFKGTEFIGSFKLKADLAFKKMNWPIPEVSLQVQSTKEE